MLNLFSDKNLFFIGFFFTLSLIFNCEPDNSSEQNKQNILLLAALNPAPRSENCNYNEFSTSESEDPFFVDQWHLSNGGEDLNLGTVWDTNKGDGVRVAVVDDGLDIYHEDLSINSIPNGGYNFGTRWLEFSSSLFDPASEYASHGTAVGGVIGARDKNGKGVKGIAPRACLAGYNLLIDLTDSNQNKAMTHNASLVWVSNNSWGATDGNGRTASSSSQWRSGINYGLTNGREGRGTVYVWAGGNGANTDNAGALGGIETDNSNLDGQANYYGVMAVCGVMDNGVRVDYSEKGANLWVCGYSQKTTFNSTLDGIWTTDISGSYGYNPIPSYYGIPQSYQVSNNNYSKIFNGTSVAAPMVSAAATLILKENPNLGWRDVKLILAESARKNDVLDSDWTTNAGSKISSGNPYNVNHKYGFGVVDISQAVELAKTWVNVGSLLTYETSLLSPNVTFSNNTTLAGGAVSNIAVTSGNTSITKIEHIDITLTTSSADASDLEVALVSPAGTTSTLAEPHACASGTTNPTSTAQTTTCGNYTGWVFGTARHLGESPVGTWTLRVADRRIGTGSSTGWGNGGTLVSWRLKFYGRVN